MREYEETDFMSKQFKSLSICTKAFMTEDELIELIGLFKSQDVYYEFINDILYLLRCIKCKNIIGENELRSFRIQDNFLHIKFNSNDCKGIRVKIDVDDIILTMIEDTKLNLSDAIIKNFMLAEIQ